MAIPKRLTHRLQQTLGDAGDDMVAWMQRVEADSGEVKALRHDMDSYRLEMRAEFAEFRRVMHEDLAATRVELHSMRVELHSMKADLMKWMLVFWVGAVGAIAALARVLP